jgi:hypothetical protein
MGNFRFLSAAAFVTSLALACSATLASFLSAVIVSLSSCAGMALVQDYRVGIVDFISLPVFAWFAVLLVGKIRRDPRSSSTLERFDLEVFRVGPLRMTDGMIAVYLVLFGIVAVILAATTFTLLRCTAILSFCKMS